MEDDKLKTWLDATKQYAVENFWKEVFNQQGQPSSYENKGPLNSNIKSLFPRCDMYEQDNQLIIDAELPGMAQEDFSIVVKGQDLTIKGKYSTLIPKIQYYLKEREDRSFEKTIILPVKVNKASAKSSYVNGVLTIKFPIINEEDAVPIYIDFHPTQISSPHQPHE